MTSPKSSVAKKDAAERQLAAAIRLFFDRGDMLAVHTLAAAGCQLVQDLGRKQGFISPVRSTDLIRPERLKEWLAALARTENFLKHADRDPDDVLQYGEEETRFLLFEAVAVAQKVLKWASREQQAYTWWFVYTYPNVFKQDFAESVQKLAVQTSVDAGNLSLWAQWIRARAT